MSSKQKDDAAFKPSTSSSETAPLLVHIAPEPIPQSNEPSAQAADTNSGHVKDEGPPLPKTQIFLLCYTRIVEPIAFFSIIPYINSMIENVGNISEEDVGFYSGVIESLFSLTQMCVMISWGKAADRWGRKPMLIFSLCGIAVMTTLFGMSQTVWQMILTRCLAGVFGGTLVTLRAMFSENSTKHTQAKAFSYFAFAGNVGIFVGPLIGKLYTLNHINQY
jgi:MFS family permease